MESQSALFWWLEELVKEEKCMIEYMKIETMEFFFFFFFFFFFGAKVNGFDCWHLADMYNNNWLGYGT